MADPPVLVADSGRRFAAFAAAVLVFVVDADQRVLLLRSPGRDRGWEIVNGGVEASETLLAALSREVAEEAGPDVRIRPLGTVHASTWRYDSSVTHMISTFFVAAYEGGEVVPGDDMAGSEVRWASLDDVRALAAAGSPLVPAEVWLFERAVECFAQWVEGPAVDLRAGWVE